VSKRGKVARLSDAERRAYDALLREMGARVAAHPAWFELSARYLELFHRGIVAQLEGESAAMQAAIRSLQEDTIVEMLVIVRDQEPVLFAELPNIEYHIVANHMDRWFELHPEVPARIREQVALQAKTVRARGDVALTTVPSVLRERMGRLPEVPKRGRPRKATGVPVSEPLSTEERAALARLGPGGGSLSRPRGFAIRTEPGLPGVADAIGALEALYEACLAIEFGRCPEGWSNGAAHYHGRDLDEPTLAAHFGVRERTLREAFFERWAIDWPAERKSYERARNEIHPDASWVPDLCRRCGKRSHVPRSPYCENCR